MLQLGFFLLIAKYTYPELWEEGENETTRRSAELPGKEKVKLKEKERRRDKGVHQTEKYNFKESGIGNSWLIGDDTGDWANAYVKGMSGCELNLIVPHKLTDEFGRTEYVEVIGQYAFNACGAKDYNGITRSIVLSRYIKVIKPLGLGNMHDVTSFEIEEGSCLESIEYKGFDGIGISISSESERSGILVLPSTVTSIAGHGLYVNNLIKTIYYCGSTNLSNYSDLEYGEVNAPDIKVTNSYKHDKIFRDYTPNTTIESIAEAEKICDKYKPEASPSPTASFKPTAGFPSKGRPVSLLRHLSRVGRSGWRGIGSLRRGELQTAESNPVKPE